MVQKNDHIVKSYADELNRLQSMISQMGGHVETMLEDAIEAIQKRDTDIATRIIEHDRHIDRLDTEIDDFTVKMLALRQPMAADLRLIVGALKISGELERVGDYIANVAKRTIALNQLPSMPTSGAIARMGRLVLHIMKDTMDALVEGDTEKSLAVWKRDEEVDEIYTSLFRELLTYMMEDPRNITPGTHLLFIAKNIERMGDHATNIAEINYYAITGKTLTEERPKGDQSSFAVIEPKA